MYREVPVSLFHQYNSLYKSYISVYKMNKKINLYRHVTQGKMVRNFSLPSYQPDVTAEEIGISTRLQCVSYAEYVLKIIKNTKDDRQQNQRDRIHIHINLSVAIN